MAFDKTWIILIAGCGVLFLAFWSGMNAVTLKMTLLWMFISFGFLTLIMHLFGSPISIVVTKLFKSAERDQQVKFTDAELKKRRQKASEIKQFLQDNKIDIYRENILEPREEMLKAKQEAEFYKFNSTWRGKGHRLGKQDEEQLAEEDFLSQEFLLHEDASSDEGSNTEQSVNYKETINNSEYTDDATYTSTQEQDVAAQSLRQRTNKQNCVLPEEPNVKDEGVITVALRCPDGVVKKRRFTLESEVKVLFAFAEWLGYSPSRHVISTTYPRKQLRDVTQTLNEAGLTHDTALVLEEI